MRLDVYLATHWPEHSRAIWQKYCKAGHVFVNGEPVLTPSFNLGEDDYVTFKLPEATDYSQKTLPIIYEDDDIIVINKPAGILTHAKGALNEEFTIAEFMRSRTTDNQDGNRPGIVHRLDRGTSGVIIAAKSGEAKRWLQKQFSTRKVKKSYLALVQGQPKEPAAKLSLPLERNPKKPQTFRVSPNGKPAETQYETIQNFKGYTLLELKPLTGRTHQLRVHLQYIGCPIVGDTLYGRTHKGFDGVFLHAARLEITLPSHERKVFEAPLPPASQQFLKTLQSP